MLISHTGNKPAFHPTKHVPDRDQALICCLRIEFPDFPRLAHSYSARPAKNRISRKLATQAKETPNIAAHDESGKK